jgi:hypothetical protein
MFNCLFHVIAVSLLVPGAGALADDSPAPDDEIPVVGRPVDLPFSGASGSFEIEARAEPTTIRAEDPIRYTLVIRATAAVRHPPERPALAKLKEFAEAFYVEDAEEPERNPDKQTVEFNYRLKPRRSDVSEIPSVPFVYFNPTIRHATKAFQIRFTDPIPLKVESSDRFAPVPALPEAFYHLATGNGLFEQDRPFRAPSPGSLVLVTIFPVAICAGWYGAWRQLYPTAVRRSRRRQSAAALHALKLLRAASQLSMREQAEQAAAALTRYLHVRFALAAADPTPAEVAESMRRLGVSSRLVVMAARFYAVCDAARYGRSLNRDALADAGARVIIEVEAAAWASQRS